ncbi:MAG: FKBP-type peptidyl-prolyl cis-trans isomerase [Bacteroidales bacterium]|nr:FKBP-type peptidyl-prolyl cis-trans isomerase [Bacteroidales bacterium]
MNRLFLKITVCLAVSALIAGCAQEKTISTGEQAQEYLELLMSTEYPDFHPNQWGMYILKDTPGTGAAWTKDLKYSSLRSTVRSMDGTILSSTEADIAQQLDESTYKPYNYYGPRYQSTAEGSGYAGLEYLLDGMKIGGSRMAVIPAWLITTSRFNTKEEYIAACTSSSHMIYEITLVGQCDDILTQEIEDIRAYVTANYGKEQESCTYKADQKKGTFYFISDSTSFKADEKRADDAVLELKYTGRRLDGQAFDTNDQAMALSQGIFVSEKAYETSSVQFSSNYSSIALNGSSSLIEGFKAGLYKMHWAGQKATVIFVSDLGYGSTGSGDLIPPYAPLIFELELQK